MPDTKNKDSQHLQTQLPPELREKLESFRGELWRTKIIESLLAGLFGLLASFLLVFLLDRFIETPGIVRLGILISGASLFIAFAPLLLRRWIWGHRNHAQLARLIAKRYPHIGDRLLGVIELRKQNADNETLSSTLRYAAMQNVNDEAKNTDLTQALPNSRQNRWALTVIALFIAALAGVIIAPQASKNAIKRWLLPLSDTPRFTYTELDNPPNHLIVPKNEAYPITLRLTAGSERVPQQATITDNSGQQFKADVSDDRAYSFLMPPQLGITNLSVKVGDVYHSIRVEPKARPSLTNLTAKISPPKYLRAATRDLSIQSGFLSVVQGSSLTISGEATRELSEITLTPTVKPRLDIEKNDTTEAPALASPWNEALTLSPRAEAFALPALNPKDNSLSINIEFTDTFGLAEKNTFLLDIETIADEAPKAYAQGTDRQIAILAKETVKFTALCEDDFGLKQIGISWTGSHLRPSPHEAAAGELELKPPTPGKRRVTREVSFSPLAYDIAPQKLSLRVWTTDDFPNRERSYSQPIEIYILTNDEHAQTVRNRLERLMSGLEDSARREQDQLDANDLLGRKSGDELMKEENRDKLREQIANEANSERKMKQLAEDMDELFRDALRNEDIDKDTMKQLAEANKSLQELSEEDIPKIKKKLDETVDPRNSAEKTKRDITEAVEQQKQALKKMREIIEKAENAKKRLEGSTFVNRLRRAARDQAGIGAALADTINNQPSRIGFTTPTLTLSQQDTVKNTELSQSTLAKDVRWIREDLLNFYNRTKKQEHKDLHDLMAGSGIDSGLSKMQLSIKLNHAFRSMVEAKKWAEKLNDWAGTLDKSLGGAGGGGGGGAGGQSPAQQDFEFMLKVMKLIQAEQDLRARTRSLEQRRRDFSTETPHPDRS